MSLVIPLSPAAGPLFRQVYLGLRQAVLNGTLRPGDQLPATRDLAERLSVSRTVVLLAYDQLLAEGFVEGRRGSGTYVAQGLTPREADPSEALAQPRLSRFGMAAQAAAPRVIIPRRQPVPLRHDFAYGRSDLGAFPLEMWRRILLRRSRRAPMRQLDYGAAAGSMALREAIASHLRRSRAVVCDAAQIIVVNGSQQALDLATRVLLERGDRVAVEDPQYQGARETLRTFGAKIIPVPVDADGLDPRQLPRRARLAFVTPSHQFPTGAVLPLPRRLALLEWAKRADAIILEDDYDGEFRYEGQPLESMQGLDRDGRVIYIGTFSRTIFPALRIGYLVAPKSLVPAFTAAKWLCDRHTATLEQETLAEFITEGIYERYLRHARRSNAVRRTALLESIERYLGDRVTMTGAGAGAHVVLWPNVREPEEEIVTRAARAGVGVYGIARYYLNPPRKPGLLLGYSQMKEREVRDGIKRLADVL